MNLFFFIGRHYDAPEIAVVEIGSSGTLLNVSGAGLDSYDGENLDN